MRQLFLAVGAITLGGLAATFALQEATREVMGPGIDQATDNVEAFAAMQEVPGAVAEIGEAATGVELSPEDEAELASWYAEDSPPDSEPEFYDAEVEDSPSESEGESYEEEGSEE